MKKIRLRKRSEPEMEAFWDGALTAVRFGWSEDQIHEGRDFSLAFPDPTPLDTPKKENV